MVFYWILSDSKSPQVSRILLSILAVLNIDVVWMVSTRPPTSKSSSPFSNPLVTVPNAPIKIGMIVTCMSHSFFNSLEKSRYLSFFSHSFSFILWSAGTAKSTILRVLFFLLIIIKSGLLAGIRWSVCMLRSHRSLCVVFSRTGAGLCMYQLLVWSYFCEFFREAAADGLSLELRNNKFLMCPGIFSIFWPILIKLYSRLSGLIFRFANVPAPLPSPKRLFQVQ